MDVTNAPLWWGMLTVEGSYIVLYIKECLPMFSSKSFIVSGLSFGSLIYFTFIFMYGVNKCSNFILLHVQFSSVAQSCPTLCDPMNRSTPGLPVRYHLPQLTQTHVHRVRDAIQPFHPGSSPSPPAPNLSQHQSLFQ